MPLKEFRHAAREFNRSGAQDETTEYKPTVKLHTGYRVVYTSKRPVRSRTETAAERTVTESIKAERNVVDLLNWQEGWDGYDAPKPKPESVAAAYEWVKGLYRDVRDVLWIRASC